MQQTVKKRGVLPRLKNDFYLKKTCQLLKFHVFQGGHKKPENKGYFSRFSLSRRNTGLPVLNEMASHETERPVKSGRIRE